MNTFACVAKCALCSLVLCLVGLPTRVAFAGCGQNPRMPDSFDETINLFAGLDAAGGIHYWFQWRHEADPEIWQSVPPNGIPEYCFCDEESSTCDTEQNGNPPGGAFTREENSECFWNTDYSDCHDMTPHNDRCQ